MISQSMVRAIFFSACFFVVGCGSESASPSTDQAVLNDDLVNASVLDFGDESVVRAGVRYFSEKWDENAGVPETLDVGDPAPAVHVSHWSKGEPLFGFSDGKVHVVEFWATWCAPCLRGMPHISQLAEEMRGEVDFIGVTREDADTVAGFLEKRTANDGDQTWRDVIKYSLVCDADGQTNLGYMTAAKQSGIPCAFIVGRDGLVEWIGHPSSIDESLRQVVDGTFDRSAALRERKLAEEKQAKAAEAWSAYRRSSSEGDFEDALDAVTEFGKFSGRDITVLKLSLMGKLDRVDEANEMISEIRARDEGDSRKLNRLAWMIADQLPENLRDWDLALEIATEAGELDDYSSFTVLDTFARIYAGKGDFDAAVEWQEKALKAHQAPAMGREALEARFKEYSAKQEAARKQADGSESDEMEPEEPNAKDAPEAAAEDTSA